MKGDPRVTDPPGQYTPDSRPGYKKWEIQKIIKNARKEDAGNYTCSIDSSATRQISRTKTVNVYGKFVSLLAENNLKYINYFIKLMNINVLL